MLLQRLESYAELQYSKDDKKVFKDFVEYMKKKKEELSRYPPEIIDAILDTLVELAPTEKWVHVSVITARLNEKFQSMESQEHTPFNENKASELLSLLGFHQRKRVAHGSIALVEHDLLKQYRDNAT